MALIDKTISSIALTEKYDAYYDTARQIIKSLAASGKTVNNTDEDAVTELVENITLFVRDNSVLSQPLEIKNNSRLRANVYNNMSESLSIDLAALFLRLKVLIAYLNNIANIINSKTSSYLEEIDMMLDKVENLKNLRNTSEQFDNIIHNTFITSDNNISDLDYRAMHQEAGGIITLNDTYSDNIITNERNFDLFTIPLNDNTIVKTHYTDISASDMNNSFDVSLYSYRQLFINNYEVGMDQDGIGIPLSYNGATLGVITRLASTKFINNLSMKFNSGGLMDIIDLYYSEESATNIKDFSWKKIDFSLDNNNIRGTAANFSTIQAASILIIFGQKSLTKSHIETKSMLSFTKEPNIFKLSEFLEKMQQNVNIISPVSKIVEYTNADVAKSLDENTSKVVSNIITELEAMLPIALDEPTSLVTNNKDYLEIIEYNFGIYELRLNYIHFLISSSYQSPIYGGKGKVADIALTTTGNIPSGTVINHYIRLENGLHKIIPNDESFTTDIITVEDSLIYIYDTELLIDANENVIVKINNIEIDSVTQFDLIKPFNSSIVATGILINDSTVELKFGDLIEITYSTPAKDSADKSYDANTVNIEKAYGNPVLKNQLLINGKTDRIIIKNNPVDGNYCYNIPEEASIKLIPAASGTTDDFTDLGIEVLTANVKQFSTFPPNFVTSLGYAVSGESASIGTKRIYYGIINEHIITNNNNVFNTEFEYIPGSLHVTFRNSLIPIDEYATDTDTPTANDKTYFSTNGTVGNLNGTIEVSYVPIDGATPGQKSNIANKNYSQTLQGTNKDGTVNLDYYPHLDNTILNDSVDNPGSSWAFSFGKFYNISNESIVYEPINVRISGREIVNKTDYVSGSVPVLNTFTGKNYEYYIKGKQLIFNTKITQQINIQYYILNDSFNYITRLYRTNRKIDDITPELYGYALYINEK